MRSRERLIRKWQSQLAELQQRVARRSDEVWLDRARIRVLRYMISRYGNRPQEAEPLYAPILILPTRDTFVAENVAERGGIPPMSPTVIRNHLQHIHRSQ